LRSHHWKKGIPEEFLNSWFQMLNTRFKSRYEEMTDFERILKLLHIPDDIILKLTGNNQNPIDREKILKINEKGAEIELPPSVNDFSEFKKWILNKLDNIEKILNN